MRLEEIAKMYGMVDYFDSHSGYIFKLREAEESPDNPDQLNVPVIDNNNGCSEFIGFAKMNKIN